MPKPTSQRSARNRAAATAALHRGCLVEQVGHFGARRRSGRSQREHFKRESVLGETGLGPLAAGSFSRVRRSIADDAGRVNGLARGRPELFFGQAMKIRRPAKLGAGAGDAKGAGPGSAQRVLTEGGSRELPSRAGAG